MTRSNRGWTGIAEAFRLWRSLWRRLAPNRLRLFAGLLVSVSQLLAALPIMWLIRHSFDRASGLSNGMSVASTIGLMVAFTLLTGAFDIAGQWLIHDATRRTVATYRHQLLERIVLLPKSAHDGTDRADLHELTVHDTERVEGMLSAVLGHMLPNSIVAGFLAVVLAVKAPAMFGLLMLALPIQFLIAHATLRRFKWATMASRGAFGSFSRSVMNGLNVLELTWLHATGRREVRQLDERIHALADAGVRTAWWAAIHQRVQQIVQLSVTATILVLGSLAVSAGQMATGELLSVYALVALTMNYVRDAGRGVGSVIMGMEAWRALELFDETRSKAPYCGERQIAFQGNVVLRKVTFRHPGGPGGNFILKEVDLELRPGRIIALTGPNGSGKTTLLNLLLGYYRPEGGQLLADGHAYGELDLEDLRRQIGVVPQDPLFIQGTIRDNLLYPNPGAPVAAFNAAVGLAQLDRFIGTTPIGFDDEIGENGVRLSGGQRQRLAIARAVLNQPRLLVLDEPTNHLDRETVSSFLDRLRGLVPPPAILIVSHLPAVAELADEVWTITNSKLVPHGSVDAFSPQKKPHAKCLV